MKRFLTYATIFIASAGALSAQNIDESMRAAIDNYFTSSLSKQDAAFDTGKVITTEEIDATTAEVWNIWRSSVNNFDEEKLIAINDLKNKVTGTWRLPSNLEPNAKMPYYFGYNATLPAGETQYPMFLHMHGSGDKNSEWNTAWGHCRIYFYRPAVYYIPQIPNGYGEYYRWAIQSKQWAWEKLLRLAFLNEQIDPNRIYFMGISEGAYGSQRLASFYADYLAGAGPMAGGEPLKNAPMENVANIAFSLRTGGNDTSFGRNILTQKALEVADELQKAHPGYYNHNIEVIPGEGHGIDYTPTAPWLAQFRRTPNPQYFYWEDFEMYGRHRKGFYNLRVDETSRKNTTQRTCYEMSIEGNTVSLNVKNVDYTTTYSQGGIDMYFSKKYSNINKGAVTLFLSNELVNLNESVKIVLNGNEIFNGKVEANIKAMVESCALFYDPERVFPAAVTIDLASGTAEVLSIESVKETTNKNEKIYDLQGREVAAPAKGIYIKEGKKVFVE